MDEKYPVKRLFFALEVSAPWPDELPKGRMLDAAHRHLTLAFLGDIDFGKLQSILNTFPTPPFKVGLTGHFDQVLFLPPRHPHVVAWQVTWDDDALPLIPYQRAVIAWLQFHGFHPDDRHDFLPHVTVCRSPFNTRAWEKQFHVLPMYIKNLHLYESIGGLRYEPRWSLPIRSPFEEFEHTADIAYRVCGESLEQIYRHAFCALAFKCPPILNYGKKTAQMKNIEDIIIRLNDVIAETDQAVGCPFKAVSFHGDIIEEEEILEWEMIVDV